MVLKPGVLKDVDGQVVHIPGTTIQFIDYRFTPIEENQEQALDAIKARGNKDFWKVTDDELETAREYKTELEKLNKKFAARREFLKKMTKPDKGVKIKEGVSSTGNISGDSNVDRMDLPDRVESLIDPPKLPEDKVDIPEDDIIPEEENITNSARSLAKEKMKDIFPPEEEKVLDGTVLPEIPYPKGAGEPEKEELEDKSEFEDGNTE